MVVKKIIRHGSSLAIVMPATWLRALRWKRGDYVMIGMTVNDLIVIKKAEDDLVGHLEKEIQYDE